MWRLGLPEQFNMAGVNQVSSGLGQVGNPGLRQLLVNVSKHYKLEVASSKGRMSFLREKCVANGFLMM